MATSTLTKQYITKDLSGSATVSASSTGVVQNTVTLSGYTPIGIIRVQKSGTNASYCSITRTHITATDWIIGLYNNRNADATCNVTVTILYEKA